MTDQVVVVWDEDAAEHEAETREATLALERVAALDGRQRTLVSVYRGPAHAAVGGNAAEGVVMYVSLDGETFQQLTTGEAAGDDELSVVAGGQGGRYPRRVVMDVAAANQALATFIEHGVADQTMNWERT